MRNKTPFFLIVGILVLGFLTIKFLGPEQQTVGPINVSIVDTNGYLLPYVRVEIENLEKGYKSSAQGWGSYRAGPFYEGKYRVVVKLGELSDEMIEVVYDRVHNFTKDTKTLGIRLENVRQRFGIEVAEQEVKIPVLPYAERKNIMISPYETGLFAQRTGINALVESKILDIIEEDFRANVDSILRDFRYITFIRQEYPTGKWIYHVVFTNLHPQSFKRDGGTHNFTFSTPNLSFTVSQNITVMNRFSYSSPTLAMSGFTIAQTTFETKDFLPK